MVKCRRPSGVLSRVRFQTSVKWTSCWIFIRSVTLLSAATRFHKRGGKLIFCMSHIFLFSSLLTSSQLTFDPHHCRLIKQPVSDSYWLSELQRDVCCSEVRRAGHLKTDFTPFKKTASNNQQQIFTKLWRSWVLVWIFFFCVHDYSGGEPVNIAAVGWKPLKRQ